MPRKTAIADDMQAQLGFDFGFNQTVDTIEALNIAVNQDEEDENHVAGVLPVFTDTDSRLG